MTDPPVALSAAEKRAHLRELLRKKSGDPRRVPASATQERLWLLHKLTPHVPVYNLPVAVRLAIPVDLAIAQRVFDEIVRRHETLRTTFAVDEGQPVQVIAPALAFRLDPVDLSGLPPAEREAKLQRLIAADAGKPFDLEAGPLLRARVARLGRDDHVLVATMHHLISDGWSLRVFADELLALYFAYLGGAPSPLPEPPVQYADFVAWQREQHAGEALVAGLAFWSRALAGPLPVLELPTDRPRPAVKRHHGAVHRFALSAPTSAALRALARAEGVTPYVVLLAAFSLLLSRYTGQTDVLVGSPVAGRPRAELAGLIGCFVNTIVLRTDLSGDPDFKTLLARVREMTLEAQAHDHVPFERLVRELRPERDLGHTPLFQVMLTLQRPPEPTPIARPLDVHTGTAKFDLSLEVIEHDDRFTGVFEYDTDLFEAATIARTAGHLETLLEGVLRAPDRRVSSAPLLTDAEIEKLDAWNDTGVAHSCPSWVHERIEAQAALVPDAVAVIFEGASLTYGALDAAANRLAHRLRALGVGPETAVGVCLDRSLELVIALLAVLKTGGAYLPLDPTQPEERLAHVLRESAAPVVVTGTVPPAWLVVAGVRLVDATAPDLASECATGPSRLVAATHLAYVMYTSGSTGSPKGAMLAHDALDNRLRWMQDAYPLTASDRVLHKTPIGFDVSVWELLWPLTAGAGLVLARPGGHRNPSYLSALIEERGITVTHFVPAMLRLFLEQPDLETRCRSLRHVIASGEPLTPELVRELHGRIGAALHNLYGPTEAAIDVTAWTCGVHDAEQPPPIGHPIANTRIHILDHGHRAVPVGHPGELHIAGAALARGYLGRPGLTAERFVPDHAGGRLYRTGDVARRRSDGAVEYLGRADRQVKIRGCRVEPGEVEAALDGHPSVRAAVVDARPDAAGEARLVAYVVARGEPAPAAAELRAFLKPRLPDYMVPVDFVMLRTLPLTPSGKVDHRALPEPHRSTASREAVTPRTDVERLLVTVWSEVLGVESIGIDDNFFDLGGASIQCLRVVARAGEAGLALTPEMVFEHQTVAELAAALEGR